MTVAVFSGDQFFSALLDNFNYKMGFVRIRNGSWMYFYMKEIMPDRWHHICFAYQEKSLKVIFDDRLGT